MKVLVTDGLEADALASLRRAHEVDVDEVDAKRLLEIVGAYDALIVRGRTKITKAVLARATRLKVVGRAGVGVDNIDVGEATARKVLVVNAPTSSTTSVAELAIGHMLSLYRHLPRSDRGVREGKWEKKALEGRELAGKVLSLVGSGRIGAEVAKRAAAFGMRVLAYDPYLRPEDGDRLGIELVDKMRVFEEADVVSIHAALTPETRHLVGAKELSLMKRTAILVNCARGEIVDEAALADALKAGAISGAALDVFEEEPPVGRPILAAPNVVFTPHLGASTREAQARAGAIVSDQVIQALSGRRPEFLVNREAY
ncbi:MAG: hydroxyacid dehydrogenase [Methanobacteriota archaeon]